ncbi:sulfatase family protein [Allorhodopirellula heiligendammensis]|uniref:Arylsulfatase n=1 Tax=Allorhodopirellula heiligendammensis TaxID=2714739 RepID=A0A5C6BXI0_9BACT|nr:sulfatase [Allorhodopirellula heiligendammensis]TWU15996.1 Arylsulfatase [Allorhodopirellula heiligendammensis]
MLKQRIRVHSTLSVKPLLILIAASLLTAGRPANADSQHADSKPNVLIITVDDMSADSLGVFGCQLTDTSPNIDTLAKQGMRFSRAHVVVGNCFPSRNVMWSGLFPHNTGVEGFYQVPDAKHLHLADLMKQAGYYTGIQHKVSHSTPYIPYPSWDVNLDTDQDGKKRDVKAARSYYDGAKQGIQAAHDAGKPFCLVMNVADPHKPFYAEGKSGATVPDDNKPSRVFTPDEVPVPGFLFDDPVVRKELSHYYSSVRRADDCVGAILEALNESRKRDQTIILFLSDHGMPLPFAKTQVYHHSSRTPLFLIVPGMTKAGTIDGTHMISAVDLLPTLLELTGIEHPGRMDGRSFAPLLRGESQDGRDYVVKEYNENAGGSRDPMRSIQTEQYLYIFNPWSNGTRVMATATTGTPTYRRMAELAKSDTNISARHDLYRHRVPEELYDIQSDPNCVNNLIGLAEYQPELAQLTTTLEQWMIRTEDGMLSVFQHRDDAKTREAYVVAQEQEADARRSGKRKNAKSASAANRNDINAVPPHKRVNYISFAEPAADFLAKQATVRIEHRLPSNLGEQVLTVTLKGGPNNARLDRKTIKISGEGTAKIEFEVPDNIAGRVSFAAFLGEEFQSSLQHIKSNIQAR